MQQIDLLQQKILQDVLKQRVFKTHQKLIGGSCSPGARSINGTDTATLIATGIFPGYKHWRDRLLRVLEYHRARRR